VLQLLGQARLLLDELAFLEEAVRGQVGVADLGQLLLEPGGGRLQTGQGQDRALAGQQFEFVALLGGGLEVVPVGLGLAACGVGVAAGALTLWAAPWLGVAAASVVGFGGTLAVKARDGLRGLFAPAPAFA
jgi:hypothetical protein